MNVLLIANSVVGYGANNSMIDMAIGLIKLGIEITVLLPGRGDIVHELRRRKISYYILPYELSAYVSISLYERVKKFIKNLLLIKDAKKIIVGKKIDIIHTNASNVDFGAILAYVCNIPHVWHIRELLKEHYNMKYCFPCLERALMHRAGRLIAISKYVAYKRSLKGNVIVIYNGFDVEKYAINKAQLFTSEIVHLLYCGEITEKKGVMDAINAIGEIVNLGHENYRLDIVGTVGDYGSKLYNYIHENRLQKYIFFHGYQTNMKLYREKTDIALMCSQNEALGRVTIESMLGECFVIGAKSGGTCELIKDGKTGSLYEPGNSKQLANKILMVHQDVERSKVIVKNAKQFAISRFDNKNYANEIFIVYRDCLVR